MSVQAMNPVYLVLHKDQVIATSASRGEANMYALNEHYDILMLPHTLIQHLYLLSRGAEGVKT